MISKYVVSVTSRLTGKKILVTCLLGEKLPLFDVDKGKVFAFRNAVKVASELKRFYPSVRVCAVRDLAIHDGFYRQGF